ncbi:MULTISPECIES: hypothetical protein [Actinoalloteichus]|uniref:Uncharacterized protein n=1 Tax=Actinoalloteichus fjordicus TaxID=1612552 RepID=A0AAC9LGX3_9PSEU|nr:MULTISPECIES: hypothetical protein [Actinoalloteichus]APU17476.1 hypothetical protein UA74_27365 [Actinoalloteichus fjordicus]APU23553.1 hypothetical protein UA75_27910 [Actinoalloteichus sp. GBA129-24]
MSNRIDLDILAGYRQPPFFFDAQDGDVFNHTIDDTARFFQLSADLVRQLKAWDQEYQDTLDMGDPSSSGFSSEEAHQAWVEKGKELAARIKRESPNVGRVGYEGRGEFQEGECVF